MHMSTGETMTSTSTGRATDEPVVAADQITAIAQEVWESFLSMSLLPHPLGPDAPPPAGVTLTGCVHVSGEWNGSVFLQCDLAVAAAAAEAMFAADPGTLSPDEVSDALGELTNMVGGNIKSLLPAPSTLSVPSIAQGESYSVRIPGAVLLDRVVLVSAPGPLHISVWKV
jgi:chemotaxis protein CheX